VYVKRENSGGQWAYVERTFCICPNSTKKMGSLPAFWAYSRYKKEIHPVIRGFCGYERSVVTVYAQSGKRGKGNKKTS